ncbi:hypothetical protein ABNX05_24260 [Lysinibacillus sp. M3]|uniref:Uncharacterized protein n=1 Tax=Lysinibacillus zambalensis TaxID=3160866 RepID=A0ABV1MZY3_9BACI
MECPKSATILQNVINFTAANFNSEEAVIIIIKAIAEDMAERRKVEQLVNEITDRIEKIIDRAFFEQNAADLEALQDLVFDYAGSKETDTGLLNHLHTLSRTLFQRFKNVNSIEGILCTILAGILYMLVLKAKDKVGIIEDENLVNRGRELGELIREKVVILYDSIAPEKTLGTCYTNEIEVFVPPQSHQRVITTNTWLPDTLVRNQFYGSRRDIPENIHEIDPKEIIKIMGDPSLEECNKERAFRFECRKQEAEGLRDSLISLAETFEQIN